MKLTLGRQNPTFSVVAVQLRADITYSKATVSVIIDERGLNKYARDYVNEIDQLTVLFGKGLITSQDATDQISQIAVQKLIGVDGYTADDDVELIIGFNRAFADSVGFNDAITSVAVDKFLFDAVTTVDQLIRSIGKPLADTQNVVDSTDIEYVDEKITVDTSLTNDLLASIGVGKLLTDAATAASSGSLRMTDYVDITYLAEDYVGSSRTFS